MSNILGFPANNFREQKPGSDDEIAEFCKATYAIDFPMFSKISVVGDDQHPLYAELTNAVPHAEGDPDGVPADRDRQARLLTYAPGSELTEVSD